MGVGFLFTNVGSRDWTLVIKLGLWYLYLLSHTTSQIMFNFK